jgi:membrane protein implicated in regulation of membrane protease activity
VKENVQMISWGIEFVTFVTAFVVVWFIWRFSQRASENRKSKHKTDRA